MNALWKASTLVILLGCFSRAAPADPLPDVDDSEQPKAAVGELIASPADTEVARTTLAPRALHHLPLGSIRPRGWLADQLRAQADGLSGHLDACWDAIGNSPWRGGDAPTYYAECGPYYLDGLTPLAYGLNDPKLIEKIQPFFDWILATGKADRIFQVTRDHWPISVALKVLIQYHEATDDPRVIAVLRDYFHFLATHEADWPLESLRGVRNSETILAAMWLHDRTGDTEPLTVVDAIALSAYNWTAQWLDFPWNGGAVHRGIIPHHGHRLHRTAHGVTLGLSIKRPALLHRLYRKPFQKEAVYRGIASLDQAHGQVGGRYSTDEHVSGRHPAQGTELCATVEYMFSMQTLVEILGDPAFADRLELLAFNALPGSLTPDCWAHQYHSQANQVLVSKAGRQFHSAGPDANIYGYMPNYPCCLANFHQGWPKYASSLWMATPKRGLAAVSYAPCRVRTSVADDVPIVVRTETEYPFEDEVRITLEPARPVEFDLRLRIPAWAENAAVTVNGKACEAEPRPGAFFTIHHRWSSGDRIVVHLPASLRIEQRYNKAAAIRRGPLYFALRIGKQFERVTLKERFKGKAPISGSIDFPGVADWAIHPTTPWNYALIVDPKSPEQSFRIKRHPLRHLPFADRGDRVYDANQKRHVTWGHDAPIVLKARGVLLPDWQLENNSAAAPPKSPVSANSDKAVEIELTPYGCARLRIAEFPWMKKDR